MILVGLTGSIAMGKSTLAAILREMGVPVFDADAAVHAFYASPESQAVEDAFPGVRAAGKIDRTKLASRVLGDAAAVGRLEAIVHPAVGRYRSAFLDAAVAQGRGFVVLDVPLLFETGGDRSVDVTVVVSTSPEAQRRRALARPGMSPEKLEAILARQMPDADKRRRAHVVVDTSGDLASTRKQAADLLRALAAFSGKIRHA